MLLLLVSAFLVTWVSVDVMAYTTLVCGRHNRCARKILNHRPLFMYMDDNGRYDPPDFTIFEDDNDDSSVGQEDSLADSQTEAWQNSPSFDDEYENDGDETSYDQYEKSEVERGNPVSSQSAQFPSERGASWMQRNAMFPSAQGDVETSNRRTDYDRPRQQQGQHYSSQRDKDTTRPSKSFRQDFRGTRVFVQGIPSDASWQDLKDHFRVAGNVVFASVSRDPRTGESKGHGVVQYENTEMAQTAIAIMRNHPLNGSSLFVREDVQEEREGATLRNRNYNNSNNNNRRQDSTRMWSCADEENSMSLLSDSDQTEVLSLIRARDDARRRRNYEVSDNIRDELKFKFGVYLDDRLKLWWVSIDGKHVPTMIQEIKGDGGWRSGKEKKQAWRQIPTTPENDACVNPDLVYGLLTQRDIARREKDFSTADMLLEQARNAPDGDLTLRIHDESRTWRIWTDEPPPKPFSPHMSPAERCIAIVQEHAPEKVEDVRMLLDKFVGREYSILKRLKQKYLN